MSSPEQIQQQIEATRDNLSSDVNRLTDKVSPSAVVGRRVDRMKGSANSLREKVMGAKPDTSRMQSAAGSVSDRAGNAPQALRQQAQGNPLAAGLIAFGVGMLASSLIPPSAAEQQLAARAEEKAQELRGPVQERAQEIGEQLKESAQQSAQQIKQTATDAASETADHARSRAEDVRGSAQG